MSNIYLHCAAVGCIAPHKKNSCYFDPKNMTERREWARKLMDKKEVECNGDEWKRGTAPTVVHRNFINENLLYEASLNCSPTYSYIPTQAAPRTLPQERHGHCRIWCNPHLHRPISTAWYSQHKCFTNYFRHIKYSGRKFVRNYYTTNPAVGSRLSNYRIHHALLHQQAFWCRAHMRCRLHSSIY